MTNRLLLRPSLTNCNLYSLSNSGSQITYNIFHPFFSNNLCNDVPDCVNNSDNFELSLDQFYYSFPVYSPQNCDVSTTKNRKNTPDRIELKKFNPILKKYTVHKEIK